MSPTLMESAAYTLGRLYPFARGMHRISESRLLGRLVPSEGLRTVTMRCGLSIEVDLADTDGRELAIFGVQELAIVRTCKKLIRRHQVDTFLDIGANHGSVGFNCSAAFTYFVEPNAQLVERIRRVSGAPFYADRCALSAGFDGSVYFRSGEGRSGTGTIALSGQPVPCKSVKSLLARIYGERIGVKVDVEGMDAEIVSELVKDPRIAFIVYEDGGAENALLSNVAFTWGFRQSRITKNDSLLSRRLP